MYAHKQQNEQKKWQAREEKEKETIEYALVCPSLRYTTAYHSDRERKLLSRFLSSSSSRRFSFHFIDTKDDGQVPAKNDGLF